MRTSGSAVALLKAGARARAFRYFILPLSLVLAFLAVAWWWGNPSRFPDNSPSLREYPIMGTWASVAFYGDKAVAGKAADAVMGAFRSVEKTCNRFDPESELSRLNRSAFEKPFGCSASLWTVLMAARDMWRESGGSFDPTITPLMELWGFYRKQNRLPSKAERDEALRKVGLDKVIFDDAARSVRFKVAGMAIDLGGIAKGHAVDLAFAAAEKAGARSGLINLGGNLRCMLEPPPGKDAYWIGARDPFDKTKSLGEFPLNNRQAAATSGNYERYVTIAGQRYTHIMDPATGLPVTGSVAVTVVSPDATRCDGLSTTFFIKGPDFAREYCRKYPECQVLFIAETPGSAKPRAFRYGALWTRFAEN